MFKVVSYSVFDSTTFDRAVGGDFSAYCREHRLDPTTPLAFHDYWKSLGAPPATLIHLGVVTSLNCYWLMPFSISVIKINESSNYASGSLLHWRSAIKEMPQNELITSLVTWLKGKQFYAYIK